MTFARDPKCSVVTPKCDLEIRSQSIPEELLIALIKSLRAIANASLELVREPGEYIKFSQQGSLMEPTDLLVTVHGTELSSALFWVFPFGYCFNFFKLQLCPVHVTHGPQTSPPNVKRVTDCLRWILALDWGSADAQMHRMMRNLMGQSASKWSLGVRTVQEVPEFPSTRRNSPS